MKTVTIGTALGFGTALDYAKAGYMIAREGWNGKGMYVKLQVPDENSKMQRPYLYMSPVDGALVPWVASQSDLLAADWTILSEEEEAQMQDTDAAQQDERAPQPQTAQLGGYPASFERLRALEIAVGLISSGNVAKGTDPVAMAESFMKFING